MPDGPRATGAGRLLFDALAAALRPFAFRGKLRLLRPLCPTSGEREAVIFGSRMRLDLSDGIQRTVFMGCYDPAGTKAFLRLLRPGMTVVDVGANCGYFSLLAASLVGSSGRVVAVEPSPAHAARLRETVEANALRQVRVFQLGLGARRGETALYLPAEPHEFHTPTMVPLPERASVRVAVETLDDCLGSWGLERVDLLKLDAEGFEAQILAGASRCLREGRIRALNCEFNDPLLRLNGTSARGLYDQIIAAGLRDAKDPPLGAPREPLEDRFFVAA